MLYKIEITETLQRTVEIEADTIDAAATKVSDMYRDEIIILNVNDFIDVTIEEG